MKYSCEMIRDLLALYMDDVCSEESKKAVKEHLQECEDCRRMLQDMSEEQTEIPTEPVSEQAVLKSTARHLTRRAVWNAAGITGIVLYWIIYFWMDFFAATGDYRYFSWSFYEVYSAGRLLVPALTLLWLIVLFVQSIRRHTVKKNGLLIALLCLLMLSQTGYEQKQSRMEYITCWTTVAEIPDEYHIVIENSGDREVLQTTPTVTGLIRQDGTVYAFTYRRDPQNPQKSRLEYVKQAEK